MVFFFNAIPDPNRKGHHMRFEDVVRSEKNLNFLENGLKLPSKEKKAQEKVKKQQEEDQKKKKHQLTSHHCMDTSARFFNSQKVDPHIEGTCFTPQLMQRGIV